MTEGEKGIGREGQGERGGRDKKRGGRDKKIGGERRGEGGGERVGGGGGGALDVLNKLVGPEQLHRVVLLDMLQRQLHHLQHQKDLTGVSQGCYKDLTGVSVYA
jgi:hypothetical protein